jgi:flagellar biogenesis protein FliO
MPRWCAAALLTLTLLLAAVSQAQAQPAAATRPAWTGQLENTPIRQGTAQASVSTSRPALNGNVEPAPGGLIDFRRLALSLAIVLSLIFALRWVTKRYFPGIAGAKSAGAVRVLGRSPVSPKQQVVLLQVGRRVLVVADNGTQMNPLSEITDADEVAQLVGQLTAPAAPPNREFEREFDKADEKLQETVNQQPLAEQMPNPDEAEIPRPGDAAEVGSAHNEINGLMEKVRVLAKELGQS